MHHVDSLIVGQGLAGTLLAQILIKKGQQLLIIDNAHKYSSSTVAAGIINPLTGRKFIKSWNFELFLPQAIKTYRTLELAVGRKILFKRNIIRVLVNTQSQNSWMAKSSDPMYQSFIAPTVDAGPIKDYVHGLEKIVEVQQGYQVELNSILNHFRQKWMQSGILVSDIFDFDKLSMERNKILYKGIIADRIVFCEGQRARFNPFFSGLPIGDSKGEVLIFKSKMPGFNKMVKKKHFIVPLPNHRFWFGSKDQWGAGDDLPTKEGSVYLKNAIHEMLLVPYSICDHKAAIRPTVKDRRPLLGSHPVYSNVYIFNGLGTKGSLLAPFWAEKMATKIINQVQVHPEVNASRFL